MKHKKMNLIGAIVMTTAFATSVLATSQAFTPEAAKAIAEKQVPKGSVYIETETDDGKYELKFYNESKKEKYEIDVNKTTQKITKYKTQLNNDNGSNDIKLKEQEIKNIVTNEIPEAQIMSVVLDIDDNLKEYDVTFKTDTYSGIITINPSTGVILEREFKIGSKASSINAQNSNLISYEEIKKKALTHVDGVITDMDLETRNNKPVYEIEIYKENYEYDLILDAVTGNKISLTSHKDSWDNDKYELDWNYHELENYNIPESSKEKISMAKAKEIALAKVTGATITKIELDYDDGRTVYEGEMRKGNLEYDFVIDAYNGNILEWSEDFDD